MLSLYDENVKKLLVPCSIWWRCSSSSEFFIAFEFCIAFDIFAFSEHKQQTSNYFRVAWSFQSAAICVSLSISTTMTTSMTTADVTTEVEALVFMFRLCQTAPRQFTGVMFFLILRCRLLQLLPNQKSPIICPQLSDVTNAVISQSPTSSLSVIFISHQRSHLPAVTTNFRSHQLRLTIRLATLPSF